MKELFRRAAAMSSEITVKENNFRIVGDKFLPYKECLQRMKEIFQNNEPIRKAGTRILPAAGRRTYPRAPGACQ